MAQEANDDTGSTISVSTASDYHEQVRERMIKRTRSLQRFQPFTVVIIENEKFSRSFGHPGLIFYLLAF